MFPILSDTLPPGWEEAGQQNAIKFDGKEAIKFDSDKPRMDLIDSEALEELARVLDFGARKYAENNWRKGIKLSRLLAASMRHLTAIMRGETYDQETGLQHAAHLMCCAMFLIWTIKHRQDLDDRWKPGAENVTLTQE